MRIWVSSKPTTISFFYKIYYLFLIKYNDFSLRPNGESCFRPGALLIIEILLEIKVANISVSNEPFRVENKHEYIRLFFWAISDTNLCRIFMKITKSPFLFQAAAAMCVGMGSFCDTVKAQGLAHFLGLFISTWFVLWHTILYYFTCSLVAAYFPLFYYTSMHQQKCFLIIVYCLKYYSLVNIIYLEPLVSVDCILTIFIWWKYFLIFNLSLIFCF